MLPAARSTQIGRVLFRQHKKIPPPTIFSRLTKTICPIPLAEKSLAVELWSFVILRVRHFWNFRIYPAWAKVNIFYHPVGKVNPSFKGFPWFSRAKEVLYFSFRPIRFHLRSRPAVLLSCCREHHCASQASSPTHPDWPHTTDSWSRVFLEWSRHSSLLGPPFTTTKNQLNVYVCYSLREKVCNWNDTLT